MGHIHDDVLNGHLRRYPEEKDYLNAFTHDFNVNWASRREISNTKVSAYFLKPSDDLRERFGLREEVLLLVTDFPTLEPRTMQAADAVLHERAATGRVDRNTFILVSLQENPDEWVGTYMLRFPGSRIPVALHAADVKRAWNDPWFVRNALGRQLYSLDLFNLQLPITQDSAFFGRDKLVSDFQIALRTRQNKGLFGLRKTGKTSILFKLMRSWNENDGALLYYDCKAPHIRGQRWYEFLHRVIRDASEKLNLGFTAPKRPQKTSEGIVNFISKIPDGKVLGVIFDEIEYITPLTKRDEHWRDDYLPFWQAIWSAQSSSASLSTMLAGVSPTICEVSRVGDAQNPLFGIVQATFLTGLDAQAHKHMVQTLGERMGMHIDESAAAQLFRRYGGHPLLSRMACSMLHRDAVLENAPRPFDISADSVLSKQPVHEREIVYYCEHIVSELKLFYPDEYEMLTLLARKKEMDFTELASDPSYVLHLERYGLVEKSAEGRYKVAIPVVGEYVALKAAREDGQRMQRAIEARENRSAWLRRRLERVIEEVRALSRIIDNGALPRLYDAGAPAEPEKFVQIGVVGDKESFTSFINVANRCLVEAIEKVGKDLGVKAYFWNDVHQTYPDYWKAMHRVKLYRNRDLHLELTEQSERGLADMLREDLEGKKMSDVPDVYFLLQQIVLDEVLLSLITESNRHG